MRHLVSALSISLVSATVCFAQGQDNKSPEAKVVDQWSGSWKVEGEFAPGQWVPEPGKFTETKKADWILKGRFVEEKIDNPRAEGRNIIGYDPMRRTYRSWFFNSDGVTGEWSGKWDEKTKTMNWTSDLGEGIDAKAWTRFKDADNYDFELTIKGPDDAMLMHITAKHARAKD